MNQGKNTGASARAQRLRNLATEAEHIGSLARLANQQLARASSDLDVLASAARGLAERLAKVADGDEVRP